MARLKGRTVTLFERHETGRDGFNAPVYEETPVEVENVLIGPESAEAMADSQGWEGRRGTCTLYLPKGDNHRWDNCRVDFFGKRWRVIGPVKEYQEELVPLDWNRIVEVERIE